MIPYSRQCIEDADIAAVVEVLRSDWLTTGPKVGEFEAAFAQVAGANHAVAFSNGTAALHGVMHARGVCAGDEVIVAANTFVASANCIVYQGAKPVFADVADATLLIDPADVEAKITSRTRGIVAVDYAGQPCDYEKLNAIAARHGIFLHADACHALGASYRGRPVGSLAGTSSFSFHPVKPITTAEGGMVTTDNAALAQRLRVFRNHGIDSDHRVRETEGTWEYDMSELGFNYRLSDLQCTLGLSQLGKLQKWTGARQSLAENYREALRECEWLTPPACLEDRTHAWHLFVARLRGNGMGRQREAFQFLRGRGVGAHVMYRPVYLHSFYQKAGYREGLCPVAEKAYGEMVILPLHSTMTAADQQSVLQAVAAFTVQNQE